MDFRRTDRPLPAAPTRGTWCARVHSARQIGDDVVVLTMKLMDGAVLHFIAGQQVRLHLPDGSRQALAIANAPRHEGVGSIEVHLQAPRHATPPQAGAAARLAVPPVQAEVRFDGPFGDFCWRDGGERPIVLLALGSGFAPLKSMVEHALEQRLHRPVHIYWGAETRDEIYLHDLVQGWADANDHIYYTPVLRVAGPQGEGQGEVKGKGIGQARWHGRTGDALDALLEDLPDLSSYRIYLSADPAIGATARCRLIDAGRAEPRELLTSTPAADRGLR